MDEAAHIDPKLFFKTIVPILSMKNTSLLCLSSPEGDSNYYSSLMTLKRPDGTSFFQVVECFQICKACRKLERIKQIQCNHVKSTAHWLSSRKIKELKLLYKASPEDAIREFGGVVMSDHLPAFRKEEVHRAFQQPPVTIQHKPPFVFTCCDPSGGGPSMLSIVSGYYTAYGDVVVRLFYFVKYVISASCTKRCTMKTMLHSPNEQDMVPSTMKRKFWRNRCKWSL